MKINLEKIIPAALAKPTKASAGRALKHAWNTVCRAKTRRLILTIFAALILIGNVSARRAAAKAAFGAPAPVYTEEPQSVDRREIIAADIAYRTSEVAEAEEVDDEAAAMARVLYGTARENSRQDKILCCWCILNRVEDQRYPNSVLGVCCQSQQWMGYADSNPVVRELYDLALEQLQIWRSGGIRPCGSEYVFMSWTSSKITLRTTFLETAQTRYHS